MTSQTTATNGRRVNEIFEGYYAELRDRVGENAPNSYVYFGETAEEVSEESGHEFDAVHQHVGSTDAEVVAYAIDLHNYDWHAIHADASEADVRTFFESCGGEICQSART